MTKKNLLKALVLEKSGMSLYKLAEKINVKAITVYRWNGGTAEPKTVNIKKISKAIEADIAEVIACFENK